MKKTLFTIITLLSFCIACNKDDAKEERITSFNVPTLTETNAIQFTATLETNEYVYLLLDGGKLAIDWGDGNVSKDMNPGKGESWRTEFVHVYETAGEYRIKIWSDELEFIHIPSLDANYKQLSVGNCPTLKEAMLNSFPVEKTINLNNCLQLELLNLNNWPQLESVILDKCTALKEIKSYSNRYLKKLDVSENVKLVSLTWVDGGLEELKFPANSALELLDCSDNKNLISVDLAGCENLHTFIFPKTKIQTFDFATLPNLSHMDCSNTAITSIDLSKNKNLSILRCVGLNLVSLDITNNVNLTVLNCANNQLTALDVSKNVNFKDLSINDNQFDKDALELIFKAMPKLGGTKMSPQYFAINIRNNPGTATCNVKLATDKGWQVLSKN